jgi:O-antigen/teichoic acid export membrane protein
MKDRIIRVISAIFMRGIGAVSQVLIYFVVARLYAPAEASTFYFSLAAITVSVPVLLMGFNTYAVKHVAKATSTNDVVVWFRAASGFLAKWNFGITLAAMALYAALRPGHPLDFLALISILMIAPAFNFIGFILQGLKWFNAAIFISNIANFGFIAVFLFAFHFFGIAKDMPDVQLSISFVVSGLCTLAIAVGILTKALPGGSLFPNFRVHRDEVFTGESTDEVFRFWIIYSLIVASNWLPQAVFYITGLADEFAFFSVAQRVSNIVIFFNIVATFMLGPYASKMYAEGEIAQLRKLFLKLCFVTTAAVLPFVVVMLVMPEKVMGIFGADYAQGAIYLQVMVVSQLINVATGSANTILIMTGHARQLVYALLISFLVGAAVTFVLGGLWGGLGYALGLAVILLIQNLITFWVVIRKVLR